MTKLENGQPYHFKIQIQFDLDNGDMQHDNMQKYRVQLEDLAREIFRSHFSNYKAGLMEATIIE